MTISPALSLKLGAIAFAVLFGAWMFWTSGTLDGSLAVLIPCAAGAGYAWYRMMRWSFRRMMLLPPEDHLSVRGNQR